MTAAKPAPLDKLKAQLAQLDQLIADGVLKGDAAKTSRDALERQVLAAVLDPASTTSECAASKPRAPRRLVLGVTVFVLAFGLAGYAWLGNRGGWQVGPGNNGDRGDTAAQAATDPAADPAAQQAQIQAMAQQLEARVKEQPDDAEAWRMLARSYGALSRFGDARDAHRRVVALKPQDAQALADLADALAMANNKTLDGEPERLILQAVKLDPSNVKALALAGTIAFNHGDYKAAVGHWERAVQVADPSSGYAQQLAGALDEARQRSGMPPVAGAASAPPATAAAATPSNAASSITGAAIANAKVSGRVTLQPALQARFGPDDTVFIFARAPSGSRMPLAILKKKVSDLPLDFSLDDSLAMSPAARLSSAAQVVVGARISKSGNAIPSPGDYQALSAPVALGTSGMQLEISTPVP